MLGFPGSSVGKNLPATWETWVQSLGWEDSLEEGMATHSSISGLENPHGPRSLAGCTPWGCKELDVTEQLSTTRGMLIIYCFFGKCSQLFFPLKSFFN